MNPINILLGIALIALAFIAATLGCFENGKSPINEPNVLDRATNSIFKSIENY